MIQTIKTRPLVNMVIQPLISNNPNMYRRRVLRVTNKHKAMGNQICMEIKAVNLEEARDAKITTKEECE